MTGRVWIRIFLVAFVLGTFGLVVDVLVTTDEERLEELSHQLGDRDQRVDGLLDWVNLTEQDFVIETPRGSERLIEGDESDLGVVLDDAFAALGAGETEVVQRSVHLQGDRATVALRVRNDVDYGLCNVTLQRHADGWRAQRLVVR